MNETQVNSLVKDIIKVFPKFFDDFKKWEYGNGNDAGKDFKRIFNKAKRIKKLSHERNTHTPATTI